VQPQQMLQAQHHQQQQQIHQQQLQQRPPVIMTNGTQVHMTPEQVQQHMMAQQQGYPPHLMQPQAHPHQQLQGQMNNGFFRSDTPNGSIRGYPSGAYSVDNGGSPNADNSQLGVKRAAESPIDGSNKKTKMYGKRPSKSFPSSNITRLTVMQRQKSIKDKHWKWQIGSNACLGLLVYLKCRDQWAQIYNAHLVK